MPYKRVDYRQNRQLHNLDKRIKKIEKETEVKYVQAGFTLTADVDPAGSGSSGSLILLNGISQSIAFGGRIGEEVFITGMTLRGLIVNQTARVTYSTCRLIIFWWKPPIDVAVSTTTPRVVGDSNSGEVVIINDNSSATAPVIYYPYSMENVDTYDIVMDKVYTINPKTIAGFTPGTGATAALTQTAINVKKKFRFGRKVRYINTGSGITDMAGNSLWMTLVASNNANPPIFNGAYRVTFKDA